MDENRRLTPREIRRSKVLGRVPVPAGTRNNLRDLVSHTPDDDMAIAAIARDEGWLTPLMPIERITLRPWQQAVFWSLRLYIVVMLVIMGWGFFHVAGA
jgi:hypothetical protein